MKSHLMVFTLCALAALFSSATSALEITAHQCSCATETQWITKAQSYGAGAQGYLYSFSVPQLRKFKNSGGVVSDIGNPSRERASSSQIPKPIPYSTNPPTVAWEVVDPDHQAYFDELFEVRNYFGHPLSAIVINYNLPVDATAPNGSPIGQYNAYSVVNTGAYNNNLQDYLDAFRQQVFGQNLASTVASQLANLLQSIDKVLTEGELLNVTVVVTFHDGSVMKYTMNIQQDGEATRVQGSGRDASNNTIIDTNSAAGGGNYVFDGTNDAVSWITHMNNLGIPVQIGNMEGGPITYNCEWNASRNTLTCRILSS